MFIALNGALRRQRRRLVMLAVMLCLAGAVVLAHSALGPGPMGGMGNAGNAIVMCLAVTESAVVAVGAVLALSALMRRALWRFPAPANTPTSVCSFIGCDRLPGGSANDSGLSRWTRATEALHGTS